ncbi:hypothetical protein S1361_03635 [Streptomyces cyanogenus]|uniref:Uncharacterized protein n=1 Tax=Streptomyces cyanogenus TaxID=80860 RepID=A0ABX7TLG5_STRCY|nr:hypothetical protein S1361_03635 [Streptomyces cyanogenus]
MVRRVYDVQDGDRDPAGLPGVRGATRVTAGDT